MRTRIVAVLAAAACAALFVEAQELVGPREDGYISSYRPQLPVPSVNAKIKDDPVGRREARLEQFGGEFTPEFMAALVTAANQQSAEYGPAGRGGIKVPPGGAWTNIGPYRSDWIQNDIQLSESDTGRIRGFLVHPTNADIVYVLKSSGGLWKTTNFSHPRPNWRPMSDTVLSTSGGAVAFGEDPETIYLGVGDPFDPGVGGSIYKSGDGGESWSNGVPIPGATIVYDLKVDTSGDFDVVLVGTNAGLFRSINGGATFSLVLPHAAATTGRFFSLQRTSAGWLAARATGAVGTLWLSTDQGATWAQVPSTVYTGAGRTTLAVALPGDEVVYAFAAAQGNGVQRDLYRSNDGGLNWTAIGLGQYVKKGTEVVWVGKVPVNPNPEQPNMDIMLGQASYNQMVLVDPADESRDTVYIGGQLSAAKSTDGGATWRVISNWLAQFGLPYVHADHHAAAIATINGKPILLFGGDGGLYTSDDGGATFSSQKNDGIASYLIYAMTGNPKHRDDVIIGLQDNGTRWRVGPTGTYNQVFGGDGFGVGWSQANDLVNLASVYYSFIIRNVRTPSNTQYKWLVGWLGIDEFFDPNRTYFNTSIATPRASADPKGTTFFHRTRQVLYRTTNGAATWQKALNVSPAVLRAGSHPIGISPDSLQHFGVLGNGGNLWFTADGGATWTNKILNNATVAGGWPGFNATLAYTNNQTMFIGNEAPVGTALRVIKSVDGGNTWTGASNGLPPVPVNKIIASTRDTSGGTLYAGTWLGVYETTDGGASWHLYGQGLPKVNVTDLYMPTDGSYLRVSTYGRGVWQINF